MISTRLNQQTLNLFSTHLKKQKVQELLNQLDALTAQVLLGGNTYALLRKIKSIINDTSYELTKSTLNKIDFNDLNLPIRKQLYKLLAKYIDDDNRKEKIANGVINFIKEDFAASSYPFHIYDDSIQTWIYEELEGINTKKDLDETVFLFDYISFLKEYVDLILDIQIDYENSIVEPVMSIVTEATSPVQDLIDDQYYLTEQYYKDLLAELYKSISSFRQELMNLKEDYYQAKLSTYDPRAVEENFALYHTWAKQFAEDQCLEVEDNDMEYTIQKWLKHKPDALLDNLDFNAIKSTARFYAIHNEKIDELEKEKEERNKAFIIDEKHTKINVLTGENLDSFSILLCDFLNLGIEKNLQHFALPNTQILLNPENRNVYMSAFLFKEFLQILPEKIVTAFATKKNPDKFTPHELIDLGLAKWQRKENEIQLCRNYLSEKEKFTDQLRKYLNIEEEKVAAHQLKKKNDSEKIEQDVVRELFTNQNANKINSFKLNSLLKMAATSTSTTENNISMILKSCNKPTLEAFIKQMEINKTKPCEKYLLLAEAQLQKITSIANKLCLFGTKNEKIITNQKQLIPSLKIVM